MSVVPESTGARLSIVAGGAALVIVVISVVALVGSGPGTPMEAMPAPHFVDETATSGIDHAYTGGSTFFEGGGVAAFDCDADARTDLFLAGGEGEAGLFRNESVDGGALRFTPMPDPTLSLDSVTGAYPLDVDSDGVTDLLVLRVGENVAFRGLGDCRFERANEAWGIDGGDESTVGFSATWGNDATMPTLAFGNYLRNIDLSDVTDPTQLCSPNVILEPSVEGYAPPMELQPALCSLSLLFTDWDRDGTADLRVTNDRQYYRSGEEQMWDMSSADVPTAYTREEGWNHLQIWGMGIASQDITGDGYPEVYLTSQGDNKLQTLTDGPEAPSYTDIAIRRGVTAHVPFVGDDSLPSTAWHPEFEDVNNDGFTDLYVSKGNVDAMPTFTDADPNNLFIGQPDGTFVEGAIDAGLVTFSRTRGAALADLNNDGLLDLVEVNRQEPVRIWRNVGSGTSDDPGTMGNWVAISLHQYGPNTNGVGSWVELSIGDLTITREVTVGGGHASGQMVPIHFGIGPASQAEARVTWPDGTIGDWVDVSAGETVTLVHPDS